MSIPSKDTVQRKSKFGDKLKDGFNDGFNKFIATFSPARSPQPSRTTTPDPSAQRGSSNTRGKAGGGKCLRLDCQQGLMNYTPDPARSLSEPEIIITLIDNGDSSGASGVASISEYFHAKSFQRLINRQRYSGFTV